MDISKPTQYRSRKNPVASKGKDRLSIITHNEDIRFPESIQFSWIRLKMYLFLLLPVGDFFEPYLLKYQERQHTMYGELSITRILMSGFVLLIMLSGQVYAEEREQYPALYQIASLEMFHTGEYAGIISIDEMKELGTIGIAGSDDLAGELIYLDGTVWQIDDEGVVTKPAGDTGICLGSVITFEPTVIFTLDKTMDTTDFFASVNDSVPNHDIPYAFRFNGEFTMMQVRSIPEQKEPYPIFSEVVNEQTVFNLTDVNGTIVGFWFPEWMKGVNYAGFHSHFIADDRNNGGHILNLTAKDGIVAIQPIQEFTVILPVGQG